MTIQAIYAAGVFKPIQPLSLPEGVRVDVVYDNEATVVTAVQPTAEEIEYGKRVKAAQSLDELLAIQSTAPPFPLGYSLCDALNANRQETGERALFNDVTSGQ